MILALISGALLFIMPFLREFITVFLMMVLFPGRVRFSESILGTQAATLFIDYYNDGDYFKPVAIRKNNYACRKVCSLIAYACQDGVNLLHIDSATHDKLMKMFSNDYLDGSRMSDKNVYYDVMGIIFEMINAGGNNDDIIDSEPYLNRIKQIIKMQSACVQA